MAILPDQRKRRVERRMKNMLIDLIMSMASYDEPLPEHSAQLQHAARSEPGIGFDLTITYGASAAHFDNGSIKDLAMVEASFEYRELMQRLSKLPEPVRIKTGERIRRWFKKKVGMPATPDVAILGRFIQQLSVASQDKISDSIDKVVVAAPLFPALTQRDINDAIVYAGLRSWLKAPMPCPAKLTQVRCDSSSPVSDDADEFYDAPESPEGNGDWKEMQCEKPRFLSLSHDTLSSPTAERFSIDSDSDTEVDESPVDGVANPADVAPTSDSTWAYVRDHLQLQKRNPLVRLFLGYEKSQNQEFVIAVRDHATTTKPLNTEQGKVVSNTSCLEETSRSIYAAARGAALYARWRQEAPVESVRVDDCVSASKHNSTADSAIGVAKKDFEL